MFHIKPCKNQQPISAILSFFNHDDSAIVFNTNKKTIQSELNKIQIFLLIKIKTVYLLKQLGLY